MQTELIIVSEYCHKCHIEPSFIDMLEEGGLINVHTEGGPSTWRGLMPSIICWKRWKI